MHFGSIFIVNWSKIIRVYYPIRSRSIVSSKRHFREMLQEADLAAAPITINQQRKQVIDFSKEFMNFGTTILVKRPEEGEKPPVDVSSKNTMRLVHVI